jgi:hypothetical protein
MSWPKPIVTFVALVAGRYQEITLIACVDIEGRATNTKAGVVARLFRRRGDYYLKP